MHELYKLILNIPYECVYACICKNVSVYIWIYVCMHVYVSMYICLYVCLFVCTYVPGTCARASDSVRMCARYVCSVIDHAYLLCV